MSLYSGSALTTRLIQSNTLSERAVGTFLRALENRFDATFLAQESDKEIAHLLKTGAQLQERAIVSSFGRKFQHLSDEPKFFAWRAAYSDNDSATGASATSNAQALASTLAEALERYLWRYDRSVLADSLKATEQEMMASGNNIVPLEKFSGFTRDQRANHRALRALSNTTLCWTRVRDILSGGRVYVPTQTVSAAQKKTAHDEPLVRPIITTGLATGVTRENALIAGILEVIERDAFMIMWLNQLTYPRIDISDLARTHEELRTLLELGARYSLSFSAVRMVTDAPAHAVLAVVEDVGQRPHAPFIVGMGCRQSLAGATAHALLEALRIRMNARTHYARMDAARIVPKEIRHIERVPYWLHDNRWHRLRFLTQGAISVLPKKDWEIDSPLAYLERLKTWCREKQYTLVSLDVGSSKQNPTRWFVESVVIPELQPMHIVERYQCLGGERLTSIPRLFDYTPRPQLFTEEPHPFA